MSGARKSGICTTCKNSGNCDYPAEDGQPILQCEEFTECASRPVAIRRSSPHRPIKLNRDAVTSGKPLGLCASCEERKTCAYPKADGGVWHCEEYR